MLDCIAIEHNRETDRYSGQVSIGKKSRLLDCAVFIFVLCKMTELSACLFISYDKILVTCVKYCILPLSVMLYI